MKKLLQSILGVTLLEIMLVLAIAAMVIVMSIRYYQSASNNQKIAAGLNVITGIVAAGESVLGARGNLSTVASDAPPYLPNGTLPNSPWGGSVTLLNGGPTSYSIRMPITTQSGICNAFQLLLQQNSKITVNCGTVGMAIVNVTE